MQCSAVLHDVANSLCARVHVFNRPLHVHIVLCTCLRPCTSLACAQLWQQQEGINFSCTFCLSLGYISSLTLWKLAVKSQKSNEAGLCILKWNRTTLLFGMGLRCKQEPSSILLLVSIVQSFGGEQLEENTEHKGNIQKIKIREAFLWEKR